MPVLGADGHRVAILGLVVIVGAFARAQLAGSRIECERLRIVPTESVGEPVGIGVRGAYRLLDLGFHRCVLGEKAGGARTLGERRGAVLGRLCRRRQGTGRRAAQHDEQGGQRGTRHSLPSTRFAGKREVQDSGHPPRPSSMKVRCGW